MVDPTAVFIDGTRIKASANKKKHIKEQVKKAAKIYAPVCLRGAHPCDKSGFVLGMAVTAGNVHDSVAWDEVYNNVLQNVQNTEIVVIDSA